MYVCMYGWMDVWKCMYMNVGREVGRYMVEVDILRSTYIHTHTYIQASWCYNAMIHPLLKMSIRGVVWDQGEQDV